MQCSCISDHFPYFTDEMSFAHRSCMLLGANLSEEFLVHAWFPKHGVSGELIMSRCIAESITTDEGRFNCVGFVNCIQNVCVFKVLYAVDKGLHGQNVLHQLLLILLHMCSQSVRPILTTKLAMSLYNTMKVHRSIYVCKDLIVSPLSAVSIANSSE